MQNLQQRLSGQEATTAGIHEAMAQHVEDIFKEFQGILPLLLGKRTLGSFVTLTLPQELGRSREQLLATLSDLIVAFDFRLISFISAIQSRKSPEDPPTLGAMLITADNANRLLQLPWELEFDSESNLIAFERSSAEGEVISGETWLSFFQTSLEIDEKEAAYDRLVEQFGDASLLPKVNP